MLEEILNKYKRTVSAWTEISVLTPRVVVDEKRIGIVGRRARGKGDVTGTMLRSISYCTIYQLKDRTTLPRKSASFLR
jgi:hypothetical protein